MARISLRHVEKRYDDVRALRDCSLDIEDHEFMAVLRESLFGEDAVVDHIDGETSLFEATLDTARDWAVVFDQKDSH